jgi:hypothetical protein
MSLSLDKLLESGCQSEAKTGLPFARWGVVRV